jgi:hypothetical protein
MTMDQKRQLVSGIIRLPPGQRSLLYSLLVSPSSGQASRVVQLGLHQADIVYLRVGSQPMFVVFLKLSQ